MVSALPPALKQPPWPNQKELDEALEKLSALPRLTSEEEVQELNTSLHEVARGDGFLLHGGECAERFEDSAAGTVYRRVDQLRKLATELRVGAGASRVATVGRIAGQYAKPRTTEYETAPDGQRILTYRGDAVHDITPDQARRVPNPRRLLTAYDHARRTLETIRASWAEQPDHTRVFVSHEMLLIPFERALLRKGLTGAQAGSTHFGWIGERTREISGAHVDFAAGIDNPVGVKLGPGTTPTDAVALARRLNPEAVEGRLTFIVRMGSTELTKMLPPVLDAVSKSSVPVIWVCDPMHGNTFQTASGVKTRSLPEIQAEVTAFVRTMRVGGAWPGGLSLELTPDPVTECVDTSREASEHCAFPAYRSACDPRLNPSQANAVVRSFLNAL